MLNVGLTGGIACGKSTVTQMFVRLGAYLIDFDVVAHQVQEPGKQAWFEIIEYFGRDILKSNGQIDRVKLGEIVFNDSEKLKKLNTIVHPHVFNAWQEDLEQIQVKNKRAVILSDVPLLFEEKLRKLFDLTLLVFVEPEKQIERLIMRNNISRDDALKRLASQMPIQEKRKMADIVIDNGGTVGETEKIVFEVWQRLVELEKAKIVDASGL